MVDARIAVQRLGNFVDRQLDRGIADGVNPELPAGLVRLADDPVNFGGLEAQLAAVLGLALVRFPGVGRRTREAAIDQHLDRANAQVFVAVAGLATEGFHLTGRVPAHLHVGPRQLAAVLTVNDFPLREAQRGFAAVGAREARDAEGELFLQYADEVLAHVRGRRLGHEPGHEILALANDAIQATILADLDDAAVRLRRVGVYFGQPQRHAVRDGAVTAGAREDDRVIGRRFVEVITQRATLLGHEVLGPAIAGDPLADTELGDLVADETLDLLDRRRLRQVDVSLRLPAQVSM